MSSPGSIFISYRREDSRGFTRNLYECLAKKLGHETVFRDLDSIPAGETFKQYIERELAQCKILIAVIGPTWLNIADRDGKRRLDDPKDRVRLEIEYALNRGIPVIPLLVNDTRMPPSDELPGALHKLQRRQCLRLRHRLFLKRRDVDWLIQVIELRIEEPKNKPNTIDLGHGVTLELVYIPGGTFLMGSPERTRNDDEKPQHKVKVPEFLMGKYPVTQAQYQTVMGKNPSRFEGDDRPVETLSWHDAVKFCEIVSQKVEETIRLPSEAQWEYACRAETTMPFYFGETIHSAQANYYGHAVYRSGQEGVYRRQTTEVGSFPPNAFGLYDMHGNVCGWCQDHWHQSYDGAPTDGSAWTQGGDSRYRVRRGGAWDHDPWLCRSAFRFCNSPESRNSGIGFRVVSALPVSLQ